MKNKILRVFSAILCVCLAFFSTAICASASPDAPDWAEYTVYTELLDTRYAVLTIETPEEYADTVDSYELSINQGDWTLQLPAEGGSLTFYSDTYVQIRYISGSEYSLVTTLDISLGGGVTITDKSTGIIAEFPYGESVPDNVSVSVYTIVSGDAYEIAEELVENLLEFSVMNLSLAVYGVTYDPGTRITWYVPIPDGFDEDCVTVYYISDDEAVELSSSTEDGYVIFKTSESGYFIFVNDNGVSLGDSDSDGSITLADARVALRCALGLEEYDEEMFNNSDADKDGSVTMSDARIILRYVLGVAISEYLSTIS